MKILVKNIFIVLFVLYTGLLTGQEIQYSYISPLPYSKYINPEQVICLKTGYLFDTSSIAEEHIQISGSKSGFIKFSVQLSEDQSVLFIKPNNKFKYGEKISVNLPDNMFTRNGLKIKDGSFYFYIDEGDNSKLVQEFYDREFYQSTNPLDKGDTSRMGFDYNNQNNLPPDYAAPTVNIYDETDDAYIFFTIVPRINSPYSDYLTIWDKYGIPVYYKKTYGQTLNFYALNNDKLAFGTTTGYNVSENRFYIMNASYEIIDTADMANGYDVDMHDFLLLSNGHYLMQSYDVRTIDMSQIVEGGHPNAKVTGLVIQEVDQQQNVYFQWRSWDHFEITDATPDIDLTDEYIDYCHGNTLTIDNDGQLLISCRNMDEITKINFQTGDLIWRWGKWAKNNEFTIYDDPTGFSHQHDIRVLPNGNYTIYDNGNNHFPQVSQAMEYEVDEESLEATLVWHYRHDPEIYAQATGSHQRLATTRSLIGWGYTSPLAITEVSLDGSETFEFFLIDQVIGYRSLKYEWETNLFLAQNLIDFGSFTGDYLAITEELPVTNNANYGIYITSTHLHNEEFFVDETFPMYLASGQTINITVCFQPEVQGYYDDVLTLNSDNSDNTQRIARQVKLTGFWDEIPPIVSIIPANGSTNLELDTIVTAIFNEPMRMPGGGIITSNYIQEMFYFKEDDINGADVPFFGAIDNEHKKIKLIPKDSLLEDQQYYIELIANMVEDRAGNKISEPKISIFHTLTLVNIPVDEFSAGINIYPIPAHDILFIDNKDASKYLLQVSLLNLQGKEVYRQILNHNQNRIQIQLNKLNSGIYYVLIYCHDFKHTEKILITK